MVWIPEEAMKRQKDYMRWTVKAAFLLVMLLVGSVFVEEYMVSEHKAQQIQETTRIPLPPPSSDLPPRSSSPAPTVALPSKIEIEIFGAKFAMSNEASWAAVAKIIVTILATFFGLRLINYVFRRLEGPQPAA